MRFGRGPLQPPRKIGGWAMVFVIRLRDIQEVAELYGSCTVVDPVHILRPDDLRPDVKSLVPVESLVPMEYKNRAGATQFMQCLPPAPGFAISGLTVRICR